MIKGIDHKKIEITEIEYKYYQELVEKWGIDSFNDLFKTDEDGKITLISPKKEVPWDVLFFIQNLMINQHIKDNEERIRALEKAIGEK